MKIVFMGTPEFAVPSLEMLFKEHSVEAVFTQPDKPKGRGHKMQCSEVKEYAVSKGLKIYQPLKIRADDESIDVLKGIAPDVIVVVAYGQFLTEDILNIPKYGCINVHASILPRLRGAAPINWAIIRGDKYAGVTTMLMAKGIDTGDMLLKSQTKINENETAGELHDRLMIMGAELLRETLIRIEDGSIIPEKQNDEESTYAPLMTKELGHIDWNQKSEDIYNLIRGVSPWPGAYTYLNDSMIKIMRGKKLSDNKGTIPGEITYAGKDGIKVSCGEGSFLIEELQEIGGKRLKVADYLNGHSIDIGICLK